MKLEGRRRSTQFEDRGTGSGGSGGNIPVRVLMSLVQLLGLKGSLVVGAVLGVGYFVLPSGVKSMLLSVLTGASNTPSGASTSGGSVCQCTQTNAAACDFSRAVLASTEDVWDEQFRAARLPRYANLPPAYPRPTLVVFERAVTTSGCGSATSAAGPFYCPADRKLYIDPGFYQVMETRLRAPGDFAQAYVIAHEVGHHVQNVIGATAKKLSGESANQTSVRVELQADCLAGVWGHAARHDLQIDEDDLREAVNAAHAIGDDTLGHTDEREFTHGTSAQRMRWFRIGFETGDARKCDTFALRRSADL